MKIKKLNKILIILVSIILILTSMQNIVSANENKATKENLEKSLTKLTDKNIKITTKSENSSEEITIDNRYLNFELGESKIRLIDKTENQVSFDINYSITNEKSRFYTDLNLNNDDDISEEEAFKIFVSQMLFIQVCYLATADMYEKDLSLAYTYYIQEYNKAQENRGEEDFKEVDSVIYKYNRYEDENNIKLDLEIDLKELEKLSEENIDYSYISTVKFIDDTQKEENDKQEEEKEQIKVNETENSILQNTVLENGSITEIPQTGKTIENIDVLFVILFVSVSVLVLYTIYNRRIDRNK